MQLALTRVLLMWITNGTCDSTDIENPAVQSKSEHIGSGRDGQISKVWDPLGKKFYAIKIFNSGPDMLEPCRHELKMNEIIPKHPNLLRFSRVLTDEEPISVLMPFMDAGTLSTFAMADATEHYVAAAMKQVLLGLQAMHSINLVHKDIKHHNILLDKGGHVLLADFTTATQLTEGGLGKPGETNLGTLCYMSPELLNDEPYGLPTDVWSVGMTVLSSFVDPYDPVDTLSVNIKSMIIDGTFNTDLSEYSPKMVDFVQKCLVADPAKRATVAQLLAHPFIAGAGGSAVVAKMISKVRTPSPTILHPYAQKRLFKLCKRLVQLSLVIFIAVVAYHCSVAFLRSILVKK